MLEQIKRVSVGAMASLLPLVSHPFWGYEGRLPVSVPTIGSALAACHPSHWPPAACNWQLAGRSKRENPSESL